MFAGDDSGRRAHARHQSSCASSVARDLGHQLEQRADSDDEDLVDSDHTDEKDASLKQYADIICNPRLFVTNGTTVAGSYIGTSTGRITRPLPFS